MNNKKRKSNNKGFSLVELIVVIAIMAILIGIMAPNLIQYIERTNVSADIQMADTIRTAVKTAIMDPVVMGETASQAAIDSLEGTTGGKDFVAFVTEKSGANYLKLGETVADILGEDGPANLDATWVADNLRSKADSGKTMSIQVFYDGKDVTVKINDSAADIEVPSK